MVGIISRMFHSNSISIYASASATIRAALRCQTRKRHLVKRETGEGVQGASKNSEFAQMQGVGKISQRRIYLICKQEIFLATQQLG